MTDIFQFLEKQADWQKKRRNLSWSEKIRLVEALQDSIRQFRGMSSVKPRRPMDPGKTKEGKGKEK